LFFQPFHDFSNVLARSRGQIRRASGVSTTIRSGCCLDKNSADGNVFVTPGYALDARGNLISCSRKMYCGNRRARPDRRRYADALLICPRDRAQDVGKIVKWLEEQKLRKLL